jgi:site-specific recombinase XerD
MTTEITIISPNPLSDQLLVEQARSYAQAGKAINTKRAYGFDWRHFTRWCEARQRTALPASVETVVLYLTDLVENEKRKVSTVERRLATISQAHQTAKLENPARAVEVRAVIKGMRRTKGVAPAYKQPVLTPNLREIVEALPDSVLGTRDRALLLLGYASAFRRSELVALDVTDLAFTTEGLVVTLGRSKTDQEGKGCEVAVPYGSYPATCPVRAVRAWLERGGITEGSVFRPVNRHGQVQPMRLSGDSVARIVKRAAHTIGLDPEEYAGHSLRSGHVTQAAANGVSERVIMDQTRHKSVTMVRRYIRKGSLWQENSAAELGL